MLTQQQEDYYSDRLTVLFGSEEYPCEGLTTTTILEKDQDTYEKEIKTRQNSCIDSKLNATMRFPCVRE